MAVDPKFFKEGETDSVFYPKGYVLAAFPDGATAEASADATVLRPLGPQLLVKYGALAVTDLLR